MSNTDFGYSQQTPVDANSDMTGVAFIVKRMIAQMDTMKLVKVVAVNGGGVAAVPPTVDVLPLVSQLDGGGNPVPYSTVYGIVCWRFQAGKTAIVLDPVVGDIGYVQCSDRDISTVVASQAQGNPGSYRRYNIADGVYVGALLGVAPTCYIFFSTDGHVKIQDTSSNVIQTSASGISLTPASGQPVVVNGDLHVTGLVIGGFGGVDQVGLTTHLHTSGGSGSPTSSPTAGT